MRTYTYGPFKSRRLGYSLGINMLGSQKLCTYNCLYCEIESRSQNKLVSPHFEYKNPPDHHFKKELTSILPYVRNIDSITFGYNGEPTLNPYILKYLTITKKVRDQIEWEGNPPRLALFTNSSTLHINKIRKRIKNFELVLAKLDAGTDTDFKRTHRPHKDVPSITSIIDSLAKLKKELSEDHKLAIQCLIYESHDETTSSNHNDNNINSIAVAFKKIKPDIIQLYSIARIPNEYYVFATNMSELNKIRLKLEKILNNEDTEIYVF
ncbi:MAG: radical SAM protein [Candidatus Lokiarchaeota archaeon]|nr:radical SAM protein [Candidatus Lokiarchaeota archaeon]MBD3201783.1 radical SAM protein [Candidatus Lokiarchaeota archaeon]